MIIATLLAAGILLPTCTTAQKVLEQQPKKKPAWVNSVVKNYIIATASSTTLEDAQEKAMIKVKEQIISSVADNISSKSEHTLVEDTKNGDMSISETYKVVTKTRAADIPFIKGISVSQIEEYYWEKVKQSNGIVYYYHVKYPFSEVQLKKLVMEYERADRQLTEQLNSLIASIDEATSVEQLQKTHAEIKALSSSFIDVDTRKSRCDVAMTSITQMLKSLSIETVSASLGEIRFTLNIGDKIYTSGTRPKAKSNCALITEITPNNDEWVLTYEYDECYDDASNKIDVEFRTQFGKAQHEYKFDIKADKVDIFVNNDINFTSGQADGDNIVDCKCFIPITSKYDSPFIIEKVILNFGSEAPIIVDNIDAKFAGKGSHNLNLHISQMLDKSVYNNKKFQTLRGTIFYKSVKTGETSTYRLYNQRYTTDW